MTIRQATPADWPALWAMLEPVLRAGDTYAIDPDISEADARTLWMEAPAETYLYEDGAQILGTYYIKKNHGGRASHVCNCGYVTAEAARGRGIARALCEHSQKAARDLGFTAMQFNMVLASNAVAVGLWQRLGYQIVGTLPDAFDHPRDGLVDGHVMWKSLA